MEIKDVNNVLKSFSKFENKDISQVPVSKSANLSTELSNEKIELSNPQIKVIISKMRELENEFSLSDIYIKALRDSYKILLGTKDVKSIQSELQKIVEDSKFNGNLLLKSIIPSDDEFYSKPSNIENLKERIAEELSNSIEKQKSLRLKLNELNIALENINAKNSSFTIEEFKNIKFNSNNLYKNLNYKEIITLIK